MIIRTKTSLDSSQSFVKVVADLTRNILASGCELHSDCAEELLADGSVYSDLWGANVYPAKKEIDFVSLINIRPQANNRSMQIESAEIRQKVEKVIKDLLIFT